MPVDSAVRPAPLWLKILAPILALSAAGVYIWSEHIREKRPVAMISSKMRQVAPASQQYILEESKAQPSRKRTQEEEKLHAYIKKIGGGRLEVEPLPVMMHSSKSLRISTESMLPAFWANIPWKPKPKETEAAPKMFHGSKVGIEIVDPDMVQQLTIMPSSKAAAIFTTSSKTKKPLTPEQDKQVEEANQKMRAILEKASHQPDKADATDSKREAPAQ